MKHAYKQTKKKHSIPVYLYNKFLEVELLSQIFVKFEFCRLLPNCSPKRSHQGRKTPTQSLKLLFLVKNSVLKREGGNQKLS